MMADDGGGQGNPYLMCDFIPTIHFLCVKVCQGKVFCCCRPNLFFFNFRHHWSERCVGFSQDMSWTDMSWHCILSKVSPYLMCAFIPTIQSLLLSSSLTLKPRIQAKNQVKSRSSQEPKQNQDQASQAKPSFSTSSSSFLLLLPSPQVQCTSKDSVRLSRLQRKSELPGAKAAYEKKYKLLRNSRKTLFQLETAQPRKSSTPNPVFSI